MKILTLPIAAIAAASAALVAFPSAETAASVPYVDNCAPRTEIVKALSEQFKEAPTAIGMVSEEAVLEVFTSEAGSFTIISTDTGGTSCIVSAGEGWQSNQITQIGQNT